MTSRVNILPSYKSLKIQMMSRKKIKLSIYVTCIFPWLQEVLLKTKTRIS